MERGLTEMNFPEFNSLLINGMIEKWIIFLIVLVVAVACDMWYIHERNCTKKENEEMRLSVNFLMLITAVVFVCVAVATIPMARDVINEDYIEVHGEYSLSPDWNKSSVNRWVHITKDDGSKIDIKFPGYSHGESKLFPSGEFTGTVWYAKNSKVIVAFIPDEPADGN